MRKIFKSFLVLMLVGLFSLITINVMATESTENTEENVEEEKGEVYTYNDGVATGELTLYEDGTFNMTLFEDGNIVTEGHGIYRVEDEYIVLITTNGELKIVINKETMTFDDYRPEPEPEPEITYTSTIVIKNCDYGDILTDIEKGNVGDVVTVYAKPYSFCRLISISVNGTELIANEEGNYQFVLVEGENVITGKFEIDSEQFKEVAQLLADAKDGNWEKIFSLENVITLIFAILSALMSSGFLITLLKYKKVESKTSTDIATSVSDKIDENSSKAIVEFLTNAIQPIFDKIDGKMVGIEEVCKTLTRCFILSQENTPESRLAIINELTALQKTNEELSAQVKAIIANEISKNEEIQNSKIRAIEELEKSNNELSNKTNNSNEKNDAEGRY